MRLIQKREIIQEITESARLYDQNLQGKNIMFIYLNNHELNFIETKFLKSNFFHLTGLISNNINPNQFYEKCLNNKIKENEIKIKKDGTTMLKLQVLKNLMCINKNAKMIGDFDKNKLYLTTDKLIGNTNECLGFKKVNKFYVSNTSLKADIRRISTSNKKIICILSKRINEKVYTEITYMNKKYEANKELLQLLDKLN